MQRSREKARHVFKYEMVNMLEAIDAAARLRAGPQDILLMDLDNQGLWKIMPKEQIDKALKSHLG